VSSATSAHIKLLKDLLMTRINPILRDFVLSVENNESQAAPLPDDEFRQAMATPFTAMLARYGYDSFTNSDEEPDAE
jgi:hypothetical protein